jgi:hypothetical protein
MAAANWETLAPFIYFGFTSFSFLSGTTAINNFFL